MKVLEQNVPTTIKSTVSYYTNNFNGIGAQHLNIIEKIEVVTKLKPSTIKHTIS